MARISGIDIPKDKRGAIALTYIYGIGRSLALTILEEAKVDLNKKVSDWGDKDIASIRDVVGKLKIEGELRSETQLCLLYTSPSPRDKRLSRMPSSA